MTIRTLLIVTILLHSPAGLCPAADYFVAPDGKADNAGTKDSPWDIASALAGQQSEAKPGDTLWLRGGTYKHPDRNRTSYGYEVKLAGAKDKPIVVRAAPRERVTIDGGLRVIEPSTRLHVRDLEILVSENLTKTRRFEETGSHPSSYDRPWGGLNIYAGEHCKYINLVIHDNAQGVSFWRGATDSELHGCIIYDNGWDAPDRGHGHAVYTQNENGFKTISDCIMTGGYGSTMHAYGSSRAFVNNYRIVGNIAYNAGRFLIGGGRPSEGINASNNYFYKVDMQLGYSAPHNEDCTVHGNVIVEGQLRINKFRQVDKKDNLVLSDRDARPENESSQVILRSNRYDENRWHVAVYNWAKQATVAVDLFGLKPGDRYKLLDPRDVYGKPVLSGKYIGRPVAAPVKGEFAAFVLVREAE